MVTVPDTRLEVYEKSWARRQGLCAALLDSEAECGLPIGHLRGDLPHQTYGPHGTRVVTYDEQRNVLSDEPRYQRSGT